MQYKIRRNPMHPLSVALPGPYVLVRFTRGTLVAHRIYLFYSSLQTSQCRRTFILFSVPCRTILQTLYSLVSDWRISRSGPIPFYWPNLLYPFLSSTILPFLFFLSISWYCGAGVLGLIWCISLSLGLALPTSLNNNNLINNAI